MGKYTFFLFARPSFIGGIARLLDFSGSLKVYNEHNTGAEADARAFMEDWRALGEDFHSAIARHNSEQRV
jgi:hypothetical protein